MAKPTPKNPLGKQIKMKRDNPMTIKKLEEAFAMDCTIGEASLYAGISCQCYYDLIKDRPELLERFEELRNNPVLQARSSVLKGVKESPELALKYLERKRNKEFNTRNETDINGEQTIHLDLKNMSTEELLKQLGAK